MAKLMEKMKKRSEIKKIHGNTGPKLSFNDPRESIMSRDRMVQSQMKQIERQAVEKIMAHRLNRQPPWHKQLRRHRAS